MAGPSIDWSDDEVRDGIRQSATHVSYFYADYMRELERRTAERQATAQFRLSVVSIVVAVIARAFSAPVERPTHPVVSQRVR